jgi:hypothetical protein
MLRLRSGRSPSGLKKGKQFISGNNEPYHELRTVTRTLRYNYMQGNKQFFSAVRCTFLMVIPGDALPEEEFEQRASEVRALCVCFVCCCYCAVTVP